MATTGYKESSFTSYYDNRVRFEWTINSYDIDTLTATMSWKLFIISKNGFSNQSISTRVTFDYNVQADVTGTHSCSAGGRVQVASGTYSGLKYSTVYSDAKIGLNTSVYATGLKINTIVSDVSISSPFPYARILSAPTQITDEANDITISFNVPEPASTSLLTLGIDFGDGYSYTTLSPNSSTFTYAITQSDRIAIYEHNTVQSFTVNIILESTVGGREYSRTKTLTCAFVNATPTFTATIVDENTTMTELTGDANKFVKGHSNAQVTITSTPLKNAYIVSETVVCGTQTLDYGSGTLYGVESSEFVITVTDSRGFINTQTITKTLVNYVTLTCNLTVDIPSSSGSTVVRIGGNCFYGSFGRETNTLTVGYRYAESGGFYSNWKTSTLTIRDNNTYSVDINVTGLDYTKGYTFEAQATDLIGTVYSVEVKVKSTPIFDWSENDFNFNVPVNFAAGFTQPNNALKQLWNGQLQFNGVDTSIDLIEPISSQANGIVLVFTPFDTLTQLPDDGKLMSFFVSKKVVQVMPSKLHTFFLLGDATFASVGAKTLYIGDTRITGHTSNGKNASASSSTNSITYNNTKFVLRYVLGV